MIVGVTGATGFLGRHLVQCLIQSGHEVVGWTRDKAKAEQAATKVLADSGLDHSKLSWLEGRLGSRDDAEALARRSDAIVHAAVDSQTPESGRTQFIGVEGEPTEYFSTNVLGTITLIEASMSNDVKRFVFVSSGAVHQRVAEGIPLDERHPLWPASIYGAAKASIETIVHAYGLSDRLPCCTIRPTSIYGVDDPICHSKWFDLVTQVAKNESVDASGGGKVVHAADVASAAEKLITTKQDVSGQTYNLCERFVSHYEVASIAKQILGSQAEINGPEKTSSNSMQTGKIKNLGVRFGEGDLLVNTISELAQSQRS